MDIFSYIFIYTFLGGIFVKELFAKMFGKVKEEFFTIPNLLSCFRILLIPIIVYLYCFAKNDIATFFLVCFSSLTDVVDGYIARKYNMITDFGKFIDPVADKATQIVVLVCLATTFPLIWIMGIVLFVKEIASLALRVVLYKETEIVEGAKWHGKVSTTLVICVIGLHLLLGQAHMPTVLSVVLIALSTAFMFYSGILYTLEAFRLLKQDEKKI